MNFQLTDEQELLRETFRGFLAKECPTPRLRELFDLGHGRDPAHSHALSETDSCAPSA